MQPLYNIWLNKFINGSFPLSGSVLYSTVLFSFPLSEVVNGTKIANCTAFGAFPLHGTVRFSTVHFLGVFHWEQFFFCTTSAEVPSDPYRYQNMSCGTRPNIDPLDQMQLLFEQTHLLYQPKNSCFVV